VIEFSEAIRLFYSNFKNFEGRSTRAEYWWVQLYMLIVAVLFALLVVLSVGGLNDLAPAELSPLTTIFIVIFFVFILAHILPGIALQIRRFHDLNQTGWLVLVFVLVGLIPLIGTLTAIGQLVWFCLRGTIGENKYGPDPLENTLF